MKREIGESEKPFGTTESDWLGRSVSSIYACEVLVYVHIISSTFFFITPFPFFSFTFPFFHSLSLSSPSAILFSSGYRRRRHLFDSRVLRFMRCEITSPSKNPVFSHLYLPSFFRFAIVR